MKVLVIAAHPDDEILGVGATICKHIDSGDEVYVCIVTKAYEPEWTKEYMEKKIDEQKKVDKLLKINKRFNLDMPTVKLNSIPHGEFNKKIIDVLDEVKPDIIYTHFEGDVNLDHTLIFNAVMVATRPTKKIRVLCFETLSETEWGRKAFHPNFWVDITKFIEKKKKAFEIYKSEVKAYPHPRSTEGIEILAKKRGIDICTKYAEAFILVKDFWC